MPVPRRALRLALLIASVAVLAPAAPALAADLLVTATDDNGSGACTAERCTLRDAVEAAERTPEPDTIRFAAQLAGATVALERPDGIARDRGASALSVTTPVAVDGSDGEDGITIARAESAPAFRLFRVAPGGALTLRDLTLTGGLARGGDGGNGGASGAGGGGAGLGGAIFNEGDLAVERTTLTGNVAAGGRGGDVDGERVTFAGGGGGGPGESASFMDPGLGGGSGGFLGAPTGAPGSFGAGGGGASNHWQKAPAGTGGFGGGGGGSGGGIPGEAGFGGGRGGFDDIATNPGAGGGGAGIGGAVFNRGGSVAMTNATLAGNAARGGAGGTALAGTFSSWSGHGGAGRGLGGALATTDDEGRAGEVVLTHVTIAGNRAEHGAGGLLRHAGTLTAVATVVARNAAPADPDTRGADMAGAGNVVGGDGVLDPDGLADNGGPTDTWPLAARSPALDGAPAGTALDQRGAARPADGDGDGDARADAGALEHAGSGVVFGGDVRAHEGGDDGTLVVRRTGPSTTAASVRVLIATGSGTPEFSIATAGSPRVEPVDGVAAITLTWEAGDGGERTVDVRSEDDLRDEDDETVVARLANPRDDVLIDSGETATVTLVDDDAPPHLAVGDVSTQELHTPGQRVRVPVTLSAPSERAVLATFSTLPGSAGAADFTGAELNVARGRPVRQSSTDHGGVPQRAVDGNTSGSYGDGSVTHTLIETEPFWEVDLGAGAPVDVVELWSRTDCCEDQSREAWVLVSDTPLPDGIAAARAAADHAVQVPARIGRPETVAIGGQGRYVRVQLEGTRELTLAEVRVRPPAGRLFLAPGASEATVDALITGDREDEDDETFTVQLADPVHATLGDAEGRVTIVDDDGPAVAVDDAVSVDEDRDTSFDVMANDDDPSGEASVSAVTSPVHGTAYVNGRRMVRYVPPREFSGSDEFTYTIDNGAGATTTATVRVIVRAVNDPPAVRGASPPFVTANAERPGTVFLAVDDPDDAVEKLTVEPCGPPTGVGVDARPVEGGLLLTVTPPGSAPPTTSTFLCVVDPGRATSPPLRLSVAVSDSNAAPQLEAPARARSREDEVVRLPVTVTDPDGAPQAVTVDAQSAPGERRVASAKVEGGGTDRTLVVTPAEDADGPLAVDLRARDTRGGARIRRVIVDVTPVNDTPRIAPMADREIVAGERATVPVETRDADGDPLALHAEAIDGGAVLGETVARDGAVHLAPPAGSGGLATVRVSVTDPAGERATRLLRVDVLPPAARRTGGSPAEAPAGPPAGWDSRPAPDAAAAFLDELDGGLFGRTAPRFTCPASAPRACVVRVRATAARGGARGALPRPGAVLATRRLAVAPGHGRVVRLRLGRTARQALRREARLRVQLEVRVFVPGSATRTRRLTVVLRGERPRRAAARAPGSSR